MKKEEVTKFIDLFDSIKHEANDKKSTVEFWYARDLQNLLEYSKWDNFVNIISKAKVACEASKHKVSDHFADVGKKVAIGLNAERKLDDIMLTRYACYLIAQNGDPKKEAIAFAQSYFATQTRKQELLEERLVLQERLKARKKLTETEKELSSNIYRRGVDERGFANIRAKGDTALFGGFNTTHQAQELWQIFFQPSRSKPKISQPKSPISTSVKKTCPEKKKFLLSMLETTEKSEKL
jgi:DNA-damage-inducible protein D